MADVTDKLKKFIITPKFANQNIQIFDDDYLEKKKRLDELIGETGKNTLKSEDLTSYLVEVCKDYCNKELKEGNNLSIISFFTMFCCGLDNFRFFLHDKWVKIEENKLGRCLDQQENLAGPHRPHKSENKNFFTAIPEEDLIRYWKWWKCEARCDLVHHNKWWVEPNFNKLMFYAYKRINDVGLHYSQMGIKEYGPSEFGICDFWFDKNEYDSARNVFISFWMKNKKEAKNKN